MQTVDFTSVQPGKTQRNEAGLRVSSSSSSSSSSSNGKDEKQEPQPMAKQETVKKERKVVIELD
jgi:hypothetical protein